MKASVQYGDFKGTSAADISDHESLEEVAERIGIDLSRYEPVGVNFYFGYSDFFSASFIARDKEKSTDDDPYMVKINHDLSRDEFFDMFKRLDVVLYSRFTDHDEGEVRDTVNLEDQ